MALVDVVCGRYVGDFYGDLQVHVTGAHSALAVQVGVVTRLPPRPTPRCASDRYNCILAVRMMGCASRATVPLLLHSRA